MNHSDLSRKILSEPINRWIFKNAQMPIFLVGGYLRDALLCRSSKDIDYVVDGNPSEIAKTVVRKFNGTLITFKEMVYRIILRDGRIIDFTPVRGSIEDDLKLRDFTINAMAWSPESKIIDPSGGLKDLYGGVIKALNPKNIEDDPLRVLRAYRHAAELSFTIDKETSLLLRLYAPELKRVSSERITYELFRTLNQMDSYPHLKKTIDDNILQEILRLKSEILKENLRLLKRYETFIIRNEKRINRFFRKKGIDDFLSEDIGQGLKRHGLYKLFLLLHSGSVLTASKKKHEKTPLRLSRNIGKAINCISKGMNLLSGRITDERLYIIFSASNGYIYEMAMILSMKSEKRLDEFLRRADDFVKFRKNPLLNGYEIQGLLRCGRGIIIGKAQALLHKAQFLRQVRTRQRAKSLILSNFT